MRHRKAAFCAFLIPFICGITGCSKAEPIGAGIGQDSHQSGEPAHRQMVVGMAWEPVGFYPLRNLDSASYYAQTLVFQGLVTWDAEMHIAPGLAQSYEVSADGRQYVFHLRPRLHFSDGQPISVDDAIESINLARGKTSPFRADYACISQVIKRADGGIQLELSSANAPLLSRLVELRVLPARLVRSSDHGYAALSRAPISSGPYRLLRWESGLELVFEPNSYFWGKQPECNLVWRVVPDRSLLASAIRHSELDIASIDPATLAAMNKANAKLPLPQQYTLDVFRGTRTVYLGFNTEHYPFDNVVVRRAICSAVDRGALISGLYAGYALVPRSDVSPGSWFYNADVREWHYDLPYAMRLLEQAGFHLENNRWVDAGKKKQLAFRILTIKDYQDVAQIVADNLGKISIPCEVQVVDYANLRRQFLQNGDYDLVLWSRSAGPDPECGIVWSSHGTMNFSRFKSGEIDDELEKGRTEIEVKGRAQAYGRVQSVLAEQLPWVFLAQPELLLLHRNEIGGTQLADQKRVGLPWDNPFFNASQWHWTK